MSDRMEWAKDLSAIGSDAVELAQRARVVWRATKNLADDAPTELARVADHAAVNLETSLDLLDQAADALLAADDVNAIPDEDDHIPGQCPCSHCTPLPRFSRPGLVSLRPGEDPANGWPR